MIGIYGGTFNPVHYGHLRTALEVREQFSLTEIRLIPCFLPAHRSQPEVSVTTRLTMLQLAIEQVAGFVVDTRELEREGPSYMVDTLSSLRHEFVDRSIILFMGSDAFSLLENWHNWQQLFDFAHIVVMTRPGFENRSMCEFLANRLVTGKHHLREQKAGYLFFQEVTLLDISATAIREMLANERDPRFLLPDSVINYIKQNKLYLS